MARAKGEGRQSARARRLDGAALASREERRCASHSRAAGSAVRMHRGRCGSDGDDFRVWNFSPFFLSQRLTMHFLLSFEPLVFFNCFNIKNRKTA